MVMKMTLRELRSLIREAVREESLGEGFLDALKRSAATAAVGASLLFPASAAANVPSSGDTYTAEESPQEDAPFVISDDEGNPHNFYLVVYVNVNGKRYAAMETDEDEMLYLFRVIISKRGDVTFRSIENDAEWEKVKAAVEEELGAEDDGEDEEITSR